MELTNTIIALRSNTYNKQIEDIAYMFDYIATNGINNSTYYNFNIEYDKFRFTTKKVIGNKDIVNDVISKITGYPRVYLDLEEYKEKWYSIKENICLNENELTNNHVKIYKVLLKNINDYRILFTENVNIPVIKTKELIEIFYNVFPAIFGDEIWIRSTLNRATDLASIYNLCIIKDISKVHDCQLIKRYNRVKSYIINIDIDSSVNNDYIITTDNFGLSTFMQVLSILKDITNDISTTNSNPIDV